MTLGTEGKTGATCNYLPQKMGSPAGMQNLVFKWKRPFCWPTSYPLPTPEAELFGKPISLNFSIAHLFVKENEDIWALWPLLEEWGSHLTLGSEGSTNATINYLAQKTRQNLVLNYIASHSTVGPNKTNRFYWYTGKKYSGMKGSVPALQRGVEEKREGVRIKQRTRNLSY